MVAFQDGTLYVYNPLSSLKPVMELTVARNPLDVCFGSGVGSDQFCLYVLDASPCISIVTPFPIVGYELPFDAYAKLLRKGHAWLLSWEEEGGEAGHLMQTTADTKWGTRVIPLWRGDASIQKGPFVHVGLCFAVHLVSPYLSTRHPSAVWRTIIVSPCGFGSWTNRWTRRCV